MLKRFHIPSLTLFAIAQITLYFTSCIKNDLPYPKIQQNITSISAVGEEREALIDSADFSVTLYLEETVNIREVKFSTFSVTDGGEADPDLLQGVYDLSKPIVVNVSRYQTYQWLVRAEQHIERSFEIEGQIGETAIDAVGRRIIVHVPQNTDLSRLEISSVKLGPAGITTMNPDLSAGVFDFSRPVRVEVTVYGETEEWTIYVEKTEQLVSTDSVDPWSRVVWAYGSCPSDMKGGFQYREATETEWHDVAQELVTQTAGAFSCHIPHLTPLTEYVVRAKAGDEAGNEVRVTTQSTADIPDGSFDQWWLKDGKIWCPWNEDGLQYWDTGNTGAATLGQSNVLPTDHTPGGSGQAAELNTRFVGFAGIGKLAAGSIYTGSFVKVDGTNGILDFGRPWTLRPTRLRGYYQYKTAPVDYASADLKHLMSRPDSCHIYVALTDWTAPFEIRTNPNNRQLFDRNADYVIGYGELIFGGTMEDYESFEIPITYRSTSRMPSYIQITCAASKYGDYFTGGTGAVLYVDEFSFDYDY